MHNEYQQALDKLQKKSRIFPDNHHARKLIVELSETNSDIEIVKESVEKFFEEIGAMRLPYQNDVGQLFEMYFNGDPPFGNKSKKAEFPDAANLMILLNFASKENGEVYVVSGDEDWSRVAERFSQIKLLKSLGDALSLGIRLERSDNGFWSDKEIFERIQNYGHKLREMISDSLQIESTVNLGDGQLDALEIREIDFLDYFTTDIRRYGDRMRCRGELIYDTNFFAEVSIDEPEMGNIFGKDIVGTEELTATIEFEFPSHHPEEIELIRVTHTDALDLRFSTRY